MCWLYSLSVVAPIHWISPLASAGLNIFDASRLPVAPPAPTIVWISSINKIIFLFFSSSFITAFILSSNWPLYFVPATRLARSSVITLFPYKILETFFSIILKARPSAIADFPTPGSPIKRGLFFFLLLNIWDTLCISFSLPITGSSLFDSAKAVISLPKLSRTGVFVLEEDFVFCFEEKGFFGSSDSSFSSGNAEEVGYSIMSSDPGSFIIDLNFSLTLSYVISILNKTFVIGSLSFLRIQRSRWAVLIFVLWNNFASRKVVFKALSACLVRWRFFFSLSPIDELSIIAGFKISIFFLNSSKLTSIEFNIEIAFPPPSLNIPSKRCSVPICLCPSLNASSLL